MMRSEPGVTLPKVFEAGKTYGIQAVEDAGCGWGRRLRIVERSKAVVGADRAMWAGGGPRDQRQVVDPGVDDPRPAVADADLEVDGHGEVGGQVNDGLPDDHGRRGDAVFE